MDSSDFERLLVDHLEHVNRVVRWTSRRHGLGPTDAEDCCSWVALRLVEYEYRLLRKFRGESSLKTFLTVVAAKLVRDFCTKQWGRWRPSATALRLGPIAVRLETLVYRDGLTFDQACGVIQQAADAPTTKELTRLLATIPPRGPLRPRPVDESALSDVRVSSNADDRIDTEERQSEFELIQRALEIEMAKLSVQERLIMHMLYVDGLSVADVARALDIPQKPLYRQVTRLKDVLRKRLIALGVSRERIQGLLEDSE